jgi:hypothetical protein
MGKRKRLHRTPRKEAISVSIKAESWQKLAPGIALSDFCDGAGCRRAMTCARYLYIPIRPHGHGRLHRPMCPDLSMNFADPKLHWMPVEDHSRDTLLAMTSDPVPVSAPVPTPDPTPVNPTGVSLFTKMIRRIFQQ